MDTPTIEAKPVVFTDEQKREIVKRYDRSDSPKTTIKRLIEKFECSEEDIKVVLREHAKKAWKTVVPPKDDSTNDTADFVQDSEEKSVDVVQGYQPKDNVDPPVQEKLPTTGTSVRSPKKEPVDWSKLFDEMASGETIEYMSDKYCISVATIKRMKSRIENKKAKEEQMIADTDDYTALEYQEPEEMLPSRIPYTLSDDYRATQIIRLVKENDSKEIKRLAGNLAVAINAQFISRELKIDLKYGR